VKPLSDPIVEKIHAIREAMAKIRNNRPNPWCPETDRGNSGWPSPGRHPRHHLPDGDADWKMELAVPIHASMR
jgi:hypothetical protein